MTTEGDGWRRDGTAVFVGTARPLADNFVPSGREPEKPMTKPVLTIEVVTDYSAFNTNKIEGYRVVLLADGKPVFSDDCNLLEEAEVSATIKRKQLGIAEYFTIAWTSPAGTTRQTEAHSSLLEASAYANKYAPKDCTSLSVTKVVTK